MNHVSEMEDDNTWTTELLDLEKIEASFVRIPENIQHKYKQIYENIGNSSRIQILQILEYQNFSSSTCESIIYLIEMCDRDKVVYLIDALRQHHLNFESFLSFYLCFNQKSLHEFLIDVKESDKILLYDIIRFIRHEEMKEIVTSMETLTCSIFIDILHKCLNSKTFRCNLCRLRRIYALETKLLCNDLPKNVLCVPGIVDTYAPKHEKWTSAENLNIDFKIILDEDDKKEFVLLFDKSTIDMVSICDNCLGDVYRSATLRNQHIEIYHLEPIERQNAAKNFRNNENLVAELMEHLSTERLKRRTRELCEKLLVKYNQGLKKESEQNRQEQLAERQRQQLNTVRQDRATLLENANLTGTKWKRNEESSTKNRLDEGQSLASLSYHVPFNNIDSNLHISNCREHPQSWQLMPVERDVNNIGVVTPVTPAAASDIFGRKPMSPDIRYKELEEWKEKLASAITSNEQKIKAEAEKEEQRKMMLYESQVDYVSERLQVFEMRHHRRKLDARQAEELRLDRRRQEKMARRVERIRDCEQRERNLMAVEDMHSYRLRLYLQEQQQEARALAGMRKEEHIQCLVDTFWGIDLAARLRREEEERRRREYEARIEELRVTCVKVKIIRPSEQEARNRVYRDRITGEVLK